MHGSVAFRMAHSRVIEPEKIIVVKWPWRNFKNRRNCFRQEGVPDTIWYHQAHNDVLSDVPTQYQNIITGKLHSNSTIQRK